MPLAPWLRALNAVGTVAEATRMFRGASSDQPAARDASDLERGLANVVVAALKEAFDRDRARFELERDEREAVRAQAEQALRVERVRQVGVQAVSQTRMLAAISVTVWVASAAAAGFLAPVPPAATWLLGLGWAVLGGSLAAAFAANNLMTDWLAREPERASAAPELPRSYAQTSLPWLVLAGFILTAASLLVTL